MHESKGQHIGKAPSLHIFHTTADAMLLDHISLVAEPACGRRMWPGDEAKTMPCILMTLTITSLQSTPTHCLSCCIEEVPYNIMLPRGSY